MAAELLLIGMFAADRLGALISATGPAMAISKHARYYRCPPGGCGIAAPAALLGLGRPALTANGSPFPGGMSA
jgi:hypothetical protein